MQDLIFGKDNTENIVSVEVKDNILYLYKELNGKIEVEKRSAEYWLVSNKKILSGTPLLGNCHYKYINTFSNWFEFLRYRKTKSYDTWSIFSPKESNIVREGITYFKGMKTDDVSVLSFDIEGTGLAINNTSKVLLISNTLRKNGVTTKKLFSYDNYATDREMFDDWCRWVREEDPSIVCGHNVFGYDFPYMSHCANEAGTSLRLGRDGSNIEYSKYFSKFRKDGSQQYDYNNLNIHGREVIDTMFLALKYDIGRKYQSYNLKQIIKQEGLEKQDRQHYDAATIGKNYTIPAEWTKIKDYAKDDADDALAIYDLMIPSYFYYSQSIPRSFQQVINTATGSQINAFMVRSYIQDGHSLPNKSEPEAYEGAISMGIPDIYENVRKVDVASLYPSIMRQYKVYDPVKDPNAHLLKTVEYFTDERLKNKQQAKITGDKYYKDLEQSQKIVINSMYGFLGTPGLLFNSPKNAAFITKNGREILLKGVEWATGHTLKQVTKNEGKKNEGLEWVLGDRVSEGKGYSLVNVDTDSFSYTNGFRPSTESFQKEIDELNSLFPDLISWENDGIYDKVVVIKAKNYVLKSGDKIKYKGSSLKDQKKEKALSDFLKEIINELLEGDKNNIPNIYNKYVKEAYNINDINRWTVKKTITKSVLNPTRTNESKVLDALKGEIINEGDKVWLYSAIDGKIQETKKGELVFYKNGESKMVDNCVLKLPKYWNNDEDKMHYVKRVYSTVEILSNLVGNDKLVKYHLKKNIPLLDKLS